MKERLEVKRRKKGQEKSSKIGVAALVLDRDENILLLLRKNPPEAGHWTIPGGGVNHQENFEEAIKREAKEEMGIDIEVGNLLIVTEPIDSEQGTPWFSPVFLVQIKAGEPKNLEIETHQELRWFSLENLPENINTTTRLAVEHYLKIRTSQKSS